MLRASNFASALRSRFVPRARPPNQATGVVAAAVTATTTSASTAPPAPARAQPAEQHQRQQQQTEGSRDRELPPHRTDTDIATATRAHCAATPERKSTDTQQQQQRRDHAGGERRFHSSSERRHQRPHSSTQPAPTTAQQVRRPDLRRSFDRNEPIDQPQQGAAASAAAATSASTTTTDPAYVCRRISTFKWATRRTIPLAQRQRIFAECLAMFDKLHLETATAESSAWMEHDDALGAVLNAAASFDLAHHALLPVVTRAATRRVLDGSMPLGRALQCVNALLRIYSSTSSSSSSSTSTDDAPGSGASAMFVRVLDRCASEFDSLTQQQLGVAASVLQLVAQRQRHQQKSDENDAQLPLLQRLLAWAQRTAPQVASDLVRRVEAAAALASSTPSRRNSDGAADASTDDVGAVRKELMSLVTVLACLVDLAPQHASTAQLCFRDLLPLLPHMAPQQVVFFISAATKLTTTATTTTTTPSTASSALPPQARHRARKLLTEIFPVCSGGSAGDRAASSAPRFRSHVSSQSAAFLARAVADLVDTLRRGVGGATNNDHDDDDDDLSDLAWQAAELVDYCCQLQFVRLRNRDVSVSPQDLVSCLDAARRLGVAAECETLMWGRRISRGVGEALAVAQADPALLRAQRQWAELVLLTTQAAAATASRAVPAAADDSGGVDATGAAGAIRFWAASVAPTVVALLKRREECRCILREDEHRLHRNVALLRSLADALLALSGGIGLPVTNEDYNDVARPLLLSNRRGPYSAVHARQLKTTFRAAVLLANQLFASDVDEETATSPTAAVLRVEAAASLLLAASVLGQLRSSVAWHGARSVLERHCRSDCPAASSVSSLDADLAVLSVLPLLSQEAQSALTARIARSFSANTASSCLVASAGKFCDAAALLLRRGATSSSSSPSLQHEATEAMLAEIAGRFRASPRLAAHFESARRTEEPLPPFVLEQLVRFAASPCAVDADADLSPFPAHAFDGVATVRQALAFGRVPLLCSALQACVLLLRTPQRLAPIRALLGVSQFAELKEAVDWDALGGDGVDRRGVNATNDEWVTLATVATGASPPSSGAEAADAKKRQQEEEDLTKRRKKQLQMPRWMAVVQRSHAVDARPLSVAVLLCALVRIQQGQTAKLVWSEVVQALLEEQRRDAAAERKPADNSNNNNSSGSASAADATLQRDAKPAVTRSIAASIPMADLVACLRYATNRINEASTSLSAPQPLLFTGSSPIDRALILHFFAPCLASGGACFLPTPEHRDLWLVSWSDIEHLSRLSSGAPAFFAASIARHIDFASVTGRMPRSTLLYFVSACAIVGEISPSPSAAVASSQSRSAATAPSATNEFALWLPSTNRHLLISPPANALPGPVLRAVTALVRDHMFRLSPDEMLLLVAGLGTTRTRAARQLTTTCATMMLLAAASSSSSPSSPLRRREFWQVVAVLARTELEWVCQSAAGVVLKQLKQREATTTSDSAARMPAEKDQDAFLNEMFTALDLLTSYPSVCSDQALWCNWAAFAASQLLVQEQDAATAAAVVVVATPLSARNIRVLLSVASRVALPEVQRIALACLDHFRTHTAPGCAADDAALLCAALDPLLPMPAQLRSAVNAACLGGFLGLGRRDEKQQQHALPQLAPRIVAQLPAAALTFLINAAAAPSAAALLEEDERRAAVVFEAVLSRLDQVLPSIRGRVLATCCSALGCFVRRWHAAAADTTASTQHQQQLTMPDVAAYAKSMLARCTLLVADRESGCSDDDLFFVADALEASLSAAATDAAFRAMVRRRLVAVVQGVLLCEEQHERRLGAAPSSSSSAGASGTDSDAGDGDAGFVAIPFSQLAAYEKALLCLMRDCDALRQTMLAADVMQNELAALKPKLEAWCKAKNVTMSA